MSFEAIKKAVDLGRRMKNVFVATADSRGLPHLASAGLIDIVSEDRVSIEAWFCPGTVQNVQDNPLISVVAWDPEMDIGFQILGKVEKMEETAILNGFSAKLEQDAPIPQSERKLIILVDQVLSFRAAPHSDKVE
ncbi:MAG: pyridoxamine 5'-phosphate oxidase family protein [Desulfobacterales bacterium]